jgi:WD40 repeat protein
MNEDENKNNSNLKLIDINGIEGCFDFNKTKKIAIHSLGTILIYWDLEKDEKNYIKYHQSTIAQVKISSNGNFFISIDKNKTPCLTLWEIPSFNIIYREYLSLNLKSLKEEFPEETKFLRDKTQTKPNFNFNENIKLKKNYKIKEIFLEFFRSNFFYILINVNSNQFDNKGNSIFKNKSKEVINNNNYNFIQIFYLFEISGVVKLNFYKIINEENECLGIRSLNNASFITIENKLIKNWKIDTKKNTIKLKKKIHLKNNLKKGQLDICEYLKLIIVMNVDRSCIILDETGLFLLSINSDFGIMFENRLQKGKLIFYIIKKLKF